MSKKKDTGTTSLFGPPTKKEVRNDREYTARTCGEIAGVSSSLATAIDCLLDATRRCDAARVTTGILSDWQAAKIDSVAKELCAVRPTIEDCRRAIDNMVAAGIAIPEKKTTEVELL